MPWLWVISLSPHLLFIVSYHNEHFCREMCNIANMRLLRPFSVITEITTKSLQKLYNRSFFGPFFTPKSFFSPLKSFWPQVLKTRFHFCKHCIIIVITCIKMYHNVSRCIKMIFILPMHVTCTCTACNNHEHVFCSVCAQMSHKLVVAGQKRRRCL